MNSYKRQAIEGSINNLLLSIEGTAASRPGLADTPKRVAKAYQELFSGYGADLSSMFTHFEAPAVDQMVFQSNIPVWSTCEHHMLPFFGKAYIAYIPGTKIIGLSKLSRIVDAYARRLQVQERLTKQVADCLMKGLECQGVAVSVRCRHLCMESRGVRTAGSQTTTTALTGVFQDCYGKEKDEFLHMVNREIQNER